MSADIASAVLEEFFLFTDDSWVTILPHAIRIVACLGVADVLAGGPMEVDELGRLTGVHASSLYRLLRALETLGVVREGARRSFKLGPNGAKLCTGVPDTVRASVSHVDSQRSWVEAMRTLHSGLPAFDRSHGATFFDHKQDDPAAGAAFSARMRERGQRVYGQLVELVDWSDSNTVLDIGGGDGFLLSRVLEATPGLRGVLFDRALDPAAPAPHERCVVVGGDFFHGLPSGADTHLLCSVLHDWDDGAAARILRGSRDALAPGGRLLIVEMVVPDDGRWHPAKWSDLSMMVLTGGCERTTSEFESLLACASYEMTSTAPIPGSWFSLLQAR